jgi:hypothetical protein
MKTNDIRVIKLMKEGFAFETLRNLNEGQINILYKRIIKEQGTVTVPKDTEPSKIADIAKTGANVQVSEEGEVSEDDVAPLKPYKGQQTQDPKQVGPSTNDGMGNYQDGMDEGEIEEKSVSKQQQKIMGLALSVKRGETPKSEVSKAVLDMVDSMTEKELEDFAGTKHKGLPKKVEKTKKESYIRNVKMIEESLIKLVQKHITPSMTKKDLLNLVEQGPGTKEAPPKVKPGTKENPGKKRWNQPKHKPAPKAKKDDETFAMQLPSFLKFDNLDITFSDEKKS